MDERQDPKHHRFRLQKFEGPLDLLLFLIQRAEVNIYDIPIAEITEQYLEQIALATDIDLDNLTEFYAMAATLIYIKSRMLLPVEITYDEEFEDPRKELIEKLIEYQKIKKYADLLSENETEVDYFFTRKRHQNPLPFDDENLWEEVSAWDLLKTFTNVLSRISPERVFDVYEEITVNEKITLMQELFQDRDIISFEDLLIRPDSPLDIICAFLAILESVKYRMIIVFQNTIFGTIQIKRAVIETRLDKEEVIDAEG